MSNPQNDEVDLLELLQALWGGKWLITGIGTAFGITAVMIAMLIPPPFRGEVAISGLDSRQISAYAPLNDIPGTSKPIYVESTFIGEAGVVRSDNLFNAFISKLQDRHQIRQALAELDPAIKSFEGSPRAKKEKIIKASRAFNLEILENYNNLENNNNINNNGVDDGENKRAVLKISTDNKERTLAILKRAMRAVFNDIRMENLGAVANISRSIQTSIAFEIEATELAIINATANYENETKARLAYLREQAAIARQLNMRESLAGFTGNAGDNIDVRINDNQPINVRTNKAPIYMRGYDALEKEASLIANRGTGEDILPFIKTYPALVNKLRNLKAEKRLERIETGLALTPLVNAQTFKPANADIDSLIFTPFISKTLILILAGIFGGIIGAIIVLLRHFTRGKKQEAA